MNKKGYAGLIAIVIILIAIFFIGWLININSRECNSNKDCDNEQYCGSDFDCHQIPVIERTVVKRSPTASILIIAITLIILAVIFRWEKIFKKQPKSEIKSETKEKTEKPKDSEPYYTSQFKYTAK